MLSSTAFLWIPKPGLKFCGLFRNFANQRYQFLFSALRIAGKKWQHSVANKNSKRLLTDLKISIYHFCQINCFCSAPKSVDDNDNCRIRFPSCTQTVLDRCRPTGVAGWSGRHIDGWRGTLYRRIDAWNSRRPSSSSVSARSEDQPNCRLFTP